MSLQTMFQKSTIAGRLMAGMAVVVSMIVIVVGLGLMYLNSLTNQIELLAGNRVPQVIAAGRWGASVLDMARHMQTLVVLMDPGEVQLELKAIKDAADEQEKLHAQIRELGAAGESGTLLAQIDDARKAYLATHTQFVQLAQAGRLDEAKVALLINVRPAQAAYIGAISKLSAFLAEETREMSRQSAAAYQKSIAGFILAALLCVAGAGVVVFLTSRSLRKQLGAEPEYARSAVEQVAGGDLTADLKLDKGDEASLLFALREMITNLRSMVDETTKGAQSVADTSAQIAQGNLDLSQRTEEQATTLEEAASSMEELTSTVAQNAQDARQASELAAGASETARKGGETVDGVVNTMDEILDASKKIADIIGVIDSIAFQTNILALNAAVEAARAGEQGRGFAVVAAEVRNLAHRTAVAAKEIKSLISDSTQKVEAGSARVDAAGHAMVGVVLSVTKVSEHIARIAAASQEQSSRIKQVSTAVKQMDTVVQQNASLVEEAAAATESMKDQAGSLLGLVSRFRLNGAGPADGDAGRPILQASAAAVPDKGPLPIRTRPRKDLPAPYFAQVGNSATGTQPKDQGWKEF